MTVIGIGDVKMDDSEKFCGIIIEATRDEVQAIAGNILYREVTITPKESEAKEGAAS